MSVFAIYKMNEFGDNVPTGEVFVPNYILSMVFEEDVKTELDQLNLDKMLYEEAHSAWRNHRLALIQQEMKEFYDMIDFVVEEKGDDIFFKQSFRSNDIKKPKRGQNSLKKHRNFEVIKMRNKMNRVVENIA